MKISNEIKIGLTVVVALAVAYVGFKLLQDSPLFGQSSDMHTYYEQVDGLTEGTPVYARGVKIGTVRRINLIGLDSVRVDISISGNYDINQGAIAFLESTDILGTKAITIRGTDQSNTLGEDGYIRGVFDPGMMGAVGDFAEEIRPSLTESTGKLGSVLSQIDGLLQDGGRDDINQTLNNLNKTTASLNQMVEDRNRDLAFSIETLNSILSSIDTLSADRKEQFDILMDNLELSSNDIVEITGELTELSNQLTTLITAINEKEGSLGKLVYEPGLYDNLDSLSYNMNELIKKFNDDPDHFLQHLRLFRLFR